MSHVNTTPHYGLPIYGENDIINPLTDFNDANSAIDTALYEIADAQGSEASDISAINTFLGDKELETVAQDVTDAINEVNTAVGNADTAIGNVAGDVVTLQTAVGDANTGLIHDVSSLQTTVGSQGNSITSIQLDVVALQGSMVTAKSDINDIKLALQGLDGEDVAYDGTVSGLSATNVQGAIDEVNGKVVSPTTPAYSTATNVEYRKVGNLVEVRCYKDSVADSTSLGTLPVGYRPTETILICNGIDPGNTRVMISATDGTVTFQNGTGSGVNCRLHTVFFA